MTATTDFWQLLITSDIENLYPSLIVALSAFILLFSGTSFFSLLFI